MKKHLVVLLIAIFIGYGAWAQMGKTMSYPQRDFIDKVAKVYYTHEIINAENEYESLVKAVVKISPNLSNDNGTIVQECLIKGNHSRHSTFHQTFGSIEIFNSQVKANIDDKGRLYSLFDNSLDTKHWPVSLINDANSLDSLAIVVPFVQSLKNVTGSWARKVIFADNNLQPEAVFCITVRRYHPGSQWLYLVNSKGNIVYKQDLTMYYCSPGDTTVKAKVYQPDPITSGHTVYDTASGYCNDNYADNPALTAQEKIVDIKAYYDTATDSFYLYNSKDTVNQYYIPGHTAGSLNAPYPVIPAGSPGFDYTRHEMSGFLYTNVMYWLNRMRQYDNDTLKIGSILPAHVHVDPMADISDQSDYLYGWGTLPSWFEFGIGGVPDAEDADVILHEHGHFVSYALAPNSVGSSFERLSVDEGQADYWAASVSRFVNPYQSDWVFNWDGHNCFWPGRSCHVPFLYKGYGWSTSEGFHHNGQIYSTAMMDIWGQYGRLVADNLEIQANLAFAQNMTMPQAAYMVLQADTILYKGVHSEGICAAFQARNLLNGFCKPQDTNLLSRIPEQLSLRNSWGFGAGTDFAIVAANKNIQDVNISVYSITGQLMLQETNASGSGFNISPARFAPGVYFVVVSTPEELQTFRLVKWASAR